MIKPRTLREQMADGRDHRWHVDFTGDPAPVDYEELELRAVAAQATKEGVDLASMSDEAVRQYVAEKFQQRAGGFMGPSLSPEAKKLMSEQAEKLLAELEKQGVIPGVSTGFKVGEIADCGVGRKRAPTGVADIDRILGKGIPFMYTPMEMAQDEAKKRMASALNSSEGHPNIAAMGEPIKEETETSQQDPAEKLRGLLAMYEEWLRSHLYEPERADTSKHWSASGAREDILDHMLWMCVEAQQFLADESKLEKGMRWLGFIQGCYAVLGEYTIDELKRHNRTELEASPRPPVVVATQQSRQENELSQQELDEAVKKAKDLVVRVLNKQAGGLLETPAGIKVENLNQAIQAGHLVGKLESFEPVSEERAKELLHAFTVGESSFSIPGQHTYYGTFKTVQQGDDMSTKHLSETDLYILNCAVAAQYITVADGSMEPNIEQAQRMVDHGLLVHIGPKTFAVSVLGRAVYAQHMTADAATLRCQVRDLVTEVSNLRKELATQKAAMQFKHALDQDMDEQAQLIRKGLGIPDDVQLGEHPLHGHTRQERAINAKLLARLAANHGAENLTVVDVRTTHGTTQFVLKDTHLAHDRTLRLNPALAEPVQWKKHDTLEIRGTVLQSTSTPATYKPEPAATPEPQEQ